ncbi:MAG: MarR family transcriptional regulator [Deltaproteobacteria bacterium]|nr:MarR family transcriptional regulator [Deltaproteobacteria bacterium]
MKAESEAVIYNIVDSIRRLVRAVYLDSQKMSKQYGLTGPQSSVLRNLVNDGPMSSADLSRTLYVTPANITGIIDRLEIKGLVKRIKKQGDRRVALITLTESGQQLGRSIPDPIINLFISELGDLELERLKLLSGAMNQVLNLIDTKGVEEAPLGFSVKL